MIYLKTKKEQEQIAKDWKATHWMGATMKEFIHRRENRFKITNVDFSKAEGFKVKCEKAKVSPTQRQASKFRNKKGAAYNCST